MAQHARLKGSLMIMAAITSLTSFAAYAHGKKVVVVNSSIVATQPYTTQGVMVKKGNTWYLGKRKGLTAKSIPGGMQFRQIENTQSMNDRGKTYQVPSALRRMIYKHSVITKAHHFAACHPAKRISIGHDKSAKSHAHKASHYVLPPMHSLPKNNCGVIYYRVLPGDTLRLIADRLLNNPHKWKTIYAANKKAIGNNPNHLVAGMTLKIPQSKN